VREKIIEACLAQAAREHYPIALAVANPTGGTAFVSSKRQCHGPYGITAQLKAQTAASFGRSKTAELYERGNKQINRAPEWMGTSRCRRFSDWSCGETVGAIAQAQPAFREARTRTAPNPR